MSPYNPIAVERASHGPIHQPWLPSSQREKKEKKLPPTSPSLGAPLPTALVRSSVPSGFAGCSPLAHGVTGSTFLCSVVGLSAWEHWAGADCNVALVASGEVCVCATEPCRENRHLDGFGFGHCLRQDGLQI